MRIRTVKKMRLDELLKHVWHEGGEHKTYMSNEGKSVDIDDSGIQFLNDYKINSGIVLSRETFTVEVEEDLKMSTKLPFMVHMYIDADGKERSENCYNQSIVECKFPVESEETSLTMYSAFGGDLTFIWNDRHGIPKSGLLEVSE